MAVNLGTAYIQIQPSTKGLIPSLKKELSGFDGVSKEAGSKSGKALTDGMGSEVKSGMPNVKGFITKAIGALGLAALGAKLGSELMSGIKGAVEVEQSRGGLEVIFEGATDQMAKQAKDAARTIGLTEDQYNKLASATGAIFKGQGMDAAKYTSAMLSRSGDIAATFGGTTAEAQEAMSAGMRGEFNALEKYGIVLTGNLINQELIARGQDKLTGAKAEAAKAEIRYDLMMQQSMDTQGQFMRENNTAGGQLAILAAQWGNLKTSLGEKFLPVLTTVVTFLNDTVIPGLENFIGSISAVKDYISANRDWAMPLIVGLTAFTSALTAYFAVIAAAQGLKAIGPLLGGMAKGLLAGGPIGLIIAAVAAVGAALYWFFTQTEVGKEIWAKVWGQIQEVAQVVADWFMGTLVPILTKAWDDIKNVALTVANWFMNTLLPILTDVWGKVSKVATDAAAWFMTHVAPVFQAFGNLVMAIVTEWIIPAFQKFGDFVSSVVNGVLLPIFQFLAAGWSLLWGHIQAVWAVVGPPLIELIKGLFQGLGIALKVIWDAIVIMLETVLGVIKGVFNAAAAVIRGDWSAAWEALKGIFSTVWEGIKGLITNSIDGLKDMLSNAWNTIKNVAKTAWDGIRDTVMGIVDPFMESLKSGIEKFGDKWDEIWNGLKSAAKTPVKFIIDTVYNDGIRKLINFVVGIVGGEKLKEISTAGFSEGGWTGPGSKYQPAGVVHADEFVISKDSRRKMERKRPGMLDYINQNGDLSGYASGGRVHPLRGGIGNTYRGHTGRDFPAATGTPVKAAGDGIITRTARLATSYGHHIRQRLDEGFGAVYAHLSRIGVSAGQRVRAGQIIGAVGNTGNSSGPHLHFGINESPGATVGFLRGAKNIGAGIGGSMGVAGGADAAAQAKLEKDKGSYLGFVKSITDGLNNKALGGEFGKMFKGMIKSTADSAIKWALEKIPGLKELISGVKTLVGDSKISKGKSTLGDQFKNPKGGYATGTNSAARGPAWVGENGPEIVNFRGGEQVYTAKESASMGAPIHIENISLPGVKNLQDLIEFLEELPEARRHGHMIGSY